MQAPLIPRVNKKLCDSDQTVLKVSGISETKITGTRTDAPELLGFADLS